MNDKNFTVFKQVSPYDSPWGIKIKILIFLWELSWAMFCRWTPKPLSFWRLFWLRMFGAKISGAPFVHQHARVEMPWNVSLSDRATLGDGAVLYSLGIIEVKERAIIAQEAYLCAATHDFSDPRLLLVTAKITIGEDAFVGARAFIMPGISIGDGAVVGACSVVTHDVPAWTVCAGNPCKSIKPRTMKKA